MQTPPRLVIHGASGRMGQAVVRLAASEGALHDFAVAVLSLSPHLADVARIAPSLLDIALFGDVE
ncbi:MAG: hypothetical protein ACTHKZ_00780, partial [Lysobacteraceae bacterium]